MKQYLKKKKQKKLEYRQENIDEEYIETVILERKENFPEENSGEWNTEISLISQSRTEKIWVSENRKKFGNQTKFFKNKIGERKMSQL